MVLKLLADHKKLYGYEMTQKVKDITATLLFPRIRKTYPRSKKTLVRHDLPVFNLETIHIPKSFTVIRPTAANYKYIIPKGPIIFTPGTGDEHHPDAVARTISASFSS
ncbi:MAG TPA: hypothetical protein VHE34_14860 [Puia sp.]|uniref:hypothetical protein n=1 Tax=Puia sp. TaxID=2045100 RepID=UPI002CC0DA81|nr:hypothetical protein [Puia sp.]HVU96506.1 hypothetical protein [Puia sp.]